MPTLTPKPGETRGEFLARWGNLLAILRAHYPDPYAWLDLAQELLDNLVTAEHRIAEAEERARIAEEERDTF
jgi:hypothetical protein